MFSVIHVLSNRACIILLIIQQYVVRAGRLVGWGTGEAGRRPVVQPGPRRRASSGGRPELTAYMYLRGKPRSAIVKVWAGGTRSKIGKE